MLGLSYRETSEIGAYAGAKFTGPGVDTEHQTSSATDSRHVSVYPARVERRRRKATTVPAVVVLSHVAPYAPTDS